MVMVFATSAQSLRPSFHPSMPSSVVSPHCSSIFSASKSHTFSTATIHSSQLTGSKGSFGVTQKARISARASTYRPNISEDLGDVTIFTAAGEPVTFKDLWDQNEGIAVVALLRHFGCPCCWELASALKESKARFDSAGVKLIAVGVGTPNKARILAERFRCGIRSGKADFSDRYHFQWIVFMRILTVRHIMFWTYTMVLAVHSSTQPVQRCYRDLMLCRKLSRTIQLKPLQMIEVAYYSREECLCSEESSYYMQGKTKGQVTMPPWMISLMSVAKLLLPKAVLYKFLNLHHIRNIHLEMVIVIIVTCSCFNPFAVLHPIK